MKPAGLLVLFAFGLSACVADPAPQMPAGEAMSSFTFVDDAFLRGVTGSALTVPAARNAAILDVTYGIQCIATNAQSRLDNAKRILDETFVVAPLLAINRRELTQWQVRASAAVQGTGCVVNRVDFATRTTDPRQTALWAVANRVPPVR